MEGSAPALAASALRGSILVDRELRALRGSALRLRAGAAPIEDAQFQPASLDLRLGAEAYRVRASFLPERTSVRERLAQLSTSRLSLAGEGAVLERGLIYLVPLEEALALPPDLSARFNPRSSTGRCDLFTRVLVDGHPRFDEAPRGFHGELWLEVAPLSFPVRLKRGDRLCQLRLQRGAPALGAAELRRVLERTPLCFEASGPHGAQRALAPHELRIDEQGALELRVGLSGRSPCAWRAALHTDVVRFAENGAHARSDFWEPVYEKDGHCILEPGRFYIFASRERLRVPPELAAEMLPVDVGVGELRNNYAGFFDNGFGWRTGPQGEPLDGGTPAVLEVRAHDLPFLVEDGQAFCRLRFFATAERPSALYGEGRGGPSYRAQDLTLARAFRGDEPAPRT